MQTRGDDGTGGFREQWRALPRWLQAALASVVVLTVGVAAVLGATALAHGGHRAASASPPTTSSSDTTDTTLPLFALTTSTVQTTQPPPPTTAPPPTTTTTTAPSPTTTSQPSTTVPARTTTTVGPPGGFCAAGMSGPLPPEPRSGATGMDTVEVSSNLARAKVAVTAHYFTGPSTSNGTTDAGGAAAVTLKFDRSQAPRGFTVVVDVNVGSGAATCRTSFMTQ